MSIKEQLQNKRGFAGMDPERRAKLAQEGGRKAAALGLGFRFNSETGAAAARKRRSKTKS